VIVTMYYFVDVILLVVYQYIRKLEACLDLPGWHMQLDYASNSVT